MSAPTSPQPNDDFRELFSQKMPTGIEGLDHLLCGGIVRTNSLLVEGAPGSGKSTLGVQILVRGAELYDECGVMVAFEEFPRQLYSEYAAYGFDLEGLEKEGKIRIIWTDPRKVIQGFTGKDDLIGRIIDEMGARRLLIDSITHFRRVASEDVDLREMLYRVLNNLKLKGVNSILVKELEDGAQESIAFEEYVVDASLRVLNREAPSGGEYKRGIQVRKTRGQEHIPGVHPFEFHDDGIRVYPHLRPKDIEERVGKKGILPVRLPTGIEGFDELIGGGFTAGSLNVLVGYSGTGKTTMARHFLLKQLKEGEKAFHLSFQESEEHYFEAGKSIGLDFCEYFENGQLDYWYIDPVGLVPEKFFIDLITRIRHGNYEVMVLDTLTDLETTVKDEDSLRETIHLLALLLRRAGITTLVLNESTEMCGLIPLTEMDFAYLSDSVIQFSLAEIDGRVHRFLGVMKMFRTNHSKNLHEFEITSQGMQVKTKATGLSGILSGNTGGKYEGMAEQILEPLTETTQKLVGLLGNPDISESTRKELGGVLERLGATDILLREHFGMTDIASLIEEFDMESS